MLLPYCDLIYNVVSGLIRLLLTECTGVDDNEAFMALLAADELWRPIGILLSFFFKLFPIVMPTGMFMLTSC